MTVQAEDIFGRLIVVKEVELYINPKGRRIRMFDCLCDCGNSCVIIGWNLTKGTTKSCGCLQREKTAERSIKHGMARTKTYKSWSEMKSRCNNPNNQAYDNYGGRGIIICKRWKLFENFYTDMGNKPYGLTLERINNNKGYSPENCKWATTKEQSRNTRNNHRIKYQDETKCIVEWSEDLGINYKTLWSRIQRHPFEIVSALEGGQYDGSI